MSNRQLELTLRARADTKDLEKLQRSVGELVTALRQSGSAFDAAAGDARAMGQAYADLTREEAKQIQLAAQTAAAVERASAARERAAAAASSAGAAQTRAAQTAAIAEEKLAQERQKSYQVMAKTEKAEIDVAKAREQLRVATARAEQAEERLAKAHKSSGLATDIVRKQLAALVTGGLALEAGRQLMQFGRDSVMAASDAEESAAKFEQVFRDLAAGTREDLESMADANRRSIYDLVTFASTLQDTFVPLGFARDQAAEMSKTVVQLGLDLAAFSNRADSEVIDNLTSALVGNHEAVRSYGIVLTETVLKQELVRIGAENLTGAALETAKAQARLNIIMRASADAQGAAVREADSYANTLKAWDAAILELKVSLGEGLLPMMTELVEVAIQAAEILKASGAFQAPFEAGLEAAESVEDIVGIVRESKQELDELDFWSWIRVNSTGWAGLDLAEKQIVRMAELAGDTAEFQRAVMAEFSRVEINTVADALGLEPTWDLDAQAEEIYRYVQALVAKEQAERDAAEMEAAYNRQREKILATDSSQVLFFEPPAPDVLAAWGALAADMGLVYENTQKAAQAQIDFNNNFAANFNAAPVGDLIQAQESLAANIGTWSQVSIDKSSEIAEVQTQLAADLTDEQRKALQDQLKDLDQFSDAYLAIVGQLEADLSDSQRFDLTKQLGELQGAHGQLASAYTGDLDAVNEARDTIRQANQDIIDSHLERAYSALSASLIEQGAWEELNTLAVGLGIMSQAEADIRTEYALTAAEIDKLTASTAFLGLTSQQQVGAIKALASGVVETADAAVRAQQGIQQLNDFYSTAPDSTQIGDFFRNLSTQAMAEGDAGITTTVAVAIDPASEVEFRGYRQELEEYDAAIYETDITSNAQDTINDFERMRDDLRNLTRNTWVIKVKYDVEGQAPAGGGGGGPTTPGPRETPDVVRNRRALGGAYFDLTVNNYGSGDITGAVKTGVVAAIRSMG